MINWLDVFFVKFKLVKVVALYNSAGFAVCFNVALKFLSRV